MSLEKWVEHGWLRREPTSPSEIKNLLGIVERSLADSKVEAVSTDLRFIAAFNAALSVATTAFRASGHRTATQAGHHVKTIESLELTTTADPSLIQRFKTFNNKRNKSVYDVAGAVTGQELEAMTKLAIELKDSTLAWLQNSPRAVEKLSPYFMSGRVIPSHIHLSVQRSSARKGFALDQ